MGGPPSQNVAGMCSRELVALSRPPSQSSACLVQMVGSLMPDRDFDDDDDDDDEGSIDEDRDSEEGALSMGESGDVDDMLGVSAMGSRCKRE